MGNHWQEIDRDHLNHAGSIFLSLLKAINTAPFETSYTTLFSIALT
jgi:hypothetical protein